MAAWSGWEGQLLTALGIKRTQNDVDFLDLWHTDTSNLGKNNPVDATEPWAGSKVINDAGIRDYPSHTAGIGATAEQLRTAPYAAILAALKSGDPYTVNDYVKVADELTTWGSVTFAGDYLNTSQAGAPKPLTAPRAHKGWADMRHSVNHNWPAALRSSEHQIAAALRSLSRARKVKL